jgi:hypothetical protein
MDRERAHGLIRDPGSEPHAACGPGISTERVVGDQFAEQRRAVSGAVPDISGHYFFSVLNPDDSRCQASARSSKHASGFVHLAQLNM